MDIHLSAGAVTILLALLGNTVALVWGAAKLSSSVDRLERFAESTGKQVGEHETRITVIEDRVGIER